MAKCFIFWSFIIILCIEQTLLETPSICGVKQVRITPRIVRGFDTEPGDWPWHAAIYHRDRRINSYACGGTLISEQFVVTASHCVNGANGYQLPTNRIFVRLGVHNLNELDGDTLQQCLIENIYKPDGNVSRSLKNDIALLKLDTIARFNEYVQPACLSSTKDLTEQVGTVVGWGVTENDEISDILKITQLPVIDPIKCLVSNRDLFGATLDEGIFCAGYTNGTSVCNGDSGGGLFFNNDDVWNLGGIVSFSDGRHDSPTLCNTGGYAAFTKVYTYLRWISSITKQNFSVSSTEDTGFDHCEQSHAATEEYYPGTLLPRNCGVYNTNRIVNGQKTKVFEFPWMASLQRNNTEGGFKHYCGGTLINRRYVLTSAVCLYFTLSDRVVLGEHTFGQDRDCNELDGERECAPPVREYGIERRIRHPNYTYPRTNDIGLIRLDKDVNFEDHIQPICLPVSSSLRALRPPWYTVTGWGVTRRDGEYSPTLLQAKITPANVSMCQEYLKTEYGRPMHDSELCVGGTNGEDVCVSDEGGPLGHPTKCNGMRFVQFGIVTLAGCGYDPSIYTNVSKFMEWVIANMEP